MTRSRTHLRATSADTSVGTAGTSARATILFLVACGIGWAQGVDLVAVVSKTISRTIELPGEFQAFQSVQIHAKMRGYVERVLVDRGSVVKRGDLLAELSAPEMQAQIAEAESKVQSVESERLQAVAQLAAAQSTSDRLKQAAETPGAISGNELIQAQKQVEAAQAVVQSKQQASRAAEAFVRAQKDLEAYLRITAPFDGVVTERLVHPGRWWDRVKTRCCWWYRTCPIYDWWLRCRRKMWAASSWAPEWSFASPRIRTARTPEPWHGLRMRSTRRRVRWRLSWMC